MFLKITISNTLIFVLTISLILISQADATWISGQVYSGDRATLLPDGKTVRLKINGEDDDYTCVTSSGGWYYWDNPPYNDGDILTVFLDGEDEKGTTITKAKNDDIIDLDIYQNHVIVRSDGPTLTIDIDDMPKYDSDEDADIRFDAEPSHCSSPSLEVYDGNILYIWPGTNFVSASAIAIINVSGSLTNLGSIADSPAVTFNANNGTHTITSGEDSFSAVTFNDGGGGSTWVLEDGLTVEENLNIISGTLDANPAEDNSINLEGSWTNSGTFLARKGTVILDNDAAQSNSITSGGSPFYNFEINPTAVATYTLEDTLDVDNNLTISAGTLDTKEGVDNAIKIEGNWTNAGTFTARSGTVTFNGTGVQEITTGGSNWSGLEVTNTSDDVIFTDSFICETFTCTALGASLNFAANKKFEITASGGLHIEGADGEKQLIVLKRYQGNPGDCWYINPSGGSWNVSYIDVQDSTNSYPIFIDPLTSTDSGNNFNWFTQEDCITQLYPSYSYVGSGALIDFSASNGGGCGLEPSYSWDVTSGIGSGISVDGNYASGNNDTDEPIEDTITVTDTSNGVSDTAIVCVGKVDCEIMVSPLSQNISSGEAIQFNAVKSEGCNLEEFYNWKVTGIIGSSINDSGIYTAGTNNTPNDITETVTVTDTENCVVATATVTVKGAVVITTTIPVIIPKTTTIPTTTTIPSITTTTIAPAPPTTTTTIMTSELRIVPQSVSASPGESITFEAIATGDYYNSHDYEWSIDSNIGSIIDQNGNYVAGINTDCSKEATDIIVVEDNANDIFAEAVVTVSCDRIIGVTNISNPLWLLNPTAISSSHLMPLFKVLFIHAENGGFDKTSSLSFEPAGNINVLSEIANGNNMLVFVIVKPNAEEGVYRATVETGSHMVTKKDALNMSLLSWTLEE